MEVNGDEVWRPVKQNMAIEFKPVEMFEISKIFIEMIWYLTTQGIKETIQSNKKLAAAFFCVCVCACDYVCGGGNYLD